MIGKVPDGWRVEKLKDITEFLTCGVAKRPEYVDKKEGIPFLSSKNAKTNRMILNDYNCVSKEDYEILTKYYKPQRGDILYTRVGSFGEAVVVNVDFDFAVFVSLTIMRVKSNIVNNHYISNILNSSFIKQIANEKARGIGVKNLNVGDVRDFLIPIPPLPQQEKIVQVLDISSALVEKQKELLKKYDLFLKSKFIEMFGDPISNPMGWEVVKLGNITKVQTGKTPSRKNAEYWANGTVNWAKTTEVNQTIMTEVEEKISDLAVKECHMIIFQENTILMAMYGQGKTRGKVVLLNVETTINQAFCAILASDNFATLYLLKLLDYMYENIRDLGRGGNQENLNLDIVRGINVILPPIELQTKFASIVEKIETIKEKETKKLKSLEDLHNTLMQKAFKGEIQ
ncbi:MAG: restriction endonuclease subunit S [Sulfurimonas sp.]|nr:restriction endonuclease subunit S [Sulfurimonas sp.]